jgi:large subunit ribosomal protein L23
MLNQMKLYEVLRRPVLTEKSNGLKDSEKKVVVDVAVWANKHQISSAAKLLFGVDVESVNTLNYRGKIKRLKNHSGKQSNFKRAYLTLKNGSDVDLFGFIGQEVKADSAA